MPDCYTQEQIAEKVGVVQDTIKRWVNDFSKDGNFGNPPESRQHFDVAPGTHCFWRSLYTLFHRKKMQGGTGANQYKEQRGQNDLSAQSENTAEKIAKEQNISPKTVKRDADYATCPSPSFVDDNIK